MWDLRWVLLGLGALLVVGVYLWTRVWAVAAFSRTHPAEPAQSRVSEIHRALRSGDPASSPPDAVVAVEPAPRKPAAPDRVITIRLIPRGDDELSTERAVVALTGAGLKHGKYGIFHREDVTGEPAFSVASLTEPGTFDLANLHETTIAGLTFFVVLPGSATP